MTQVRNLFFLLCIILSTLSTPLLAGPFDFDNDFWSNGRGTVSTPVASGGGFTQTANGTIFAASLNMELLSATWNGTDRFLDYDENGFDRLNFFISGSGESLTFNGLLKNEAEQWALDNADELIQIIFGGSPAAYLTGQSAAHGESALVMESLVFNSSKNKRISKKGFVLSGYDSQADGYMNYTKFDNGDFKGDRYGLTAGYNTDLSDSIELNILLPYQYISSNDTAKSSSHVLKPGIGLKYHALENEANDVFVGAYINGTAVYSNGDLGDVGYLRYSGSVYASYTYYMKSDLAITSGVSLTMGRYATPDLGSDYEFLEKAIEGYGTDKVIGVGVLFEYALNDNINLDFFIHGARNNNSDLIDGKSEVSIGPALKYTVSDAFEAKIGYRYTNVTDGDITSNALVLNGTYRF